MTGTLLQPLARPLLRGIARREGDAIVFTCTGIDSTNLDAESRVGIELARVREPADAVAFVGRYGVLGSLPEDLILSWETIRVVSTLKKPVELRESLQDVLQAARELSRVFRLAVDAQRAAKGDKAAEQRLARNVRTNDFDEMTFSRGIDSRAAFVSRTLALDLSDRLKTARPHVQAADAGRFKIRLLSPTLLDYCYVSATLTLTATRERLATCDECARVFVVDDGRQRFCEPRCANRARFRRFKERREEEISAGKKKGDRRGKKTRTR